jgi:actinorhodin biosynthesis protein ActVIA
MTTTTMTTTTMTTTADVYAQVHAFYTRHYGLIDAGSVQDCAQTFTPDAIMIRHGTPERMRAAAGVRQGRADIAEALGRVTRRRAAEGTVRRHLVGPLTVTASAPGRVDARYYLLVIDTPASRQPVLRGSAVVHDVLVRRDGQWLTHSRRVDHDDARTGPELKGGHR